MAILPKRMLNLGCGATFHEDWVNIDFSDHGGKVMAYNLCLGIPFADESFDVVYHSHVLEHMPKAWGGLQGAEKGAQRYANLYADILQRGMMS